MLECWNNGVLELPRIQELKATAALHHSTSNQQFDGDINITLDDNSAGAITFAGNTDIKKDLTAKTSGGVINQTGGTLSVGGTTTLEVGATKNITLNSQNEFTGAVTIKDGNNVQITDSGGLTISGVTWQGDLTATAASGITVTNQLDLGNKEANFNPGAGQNVALDGGIAVTFNNSSDYGKITSNGSLDLTGQFSDTYNFSPSLNDTFRIIDLPNPTHSVTGSFTGRPEGETIVNGGANDRITYSGGDDGNDVELVPIHELMVVGSGEGAAPHVRVYDQTPGNTPVLDIHPYEDTFLGGVRVAAGDVNGDGWDDIITVPGSGGGPHVKVLDGKDGSVLHNFFAYDQTFKGGLTVAAGDVNGDNVADIVTVAGIGAGPHVKVFNGQDMSELYSFHAYEPEFVGSVSVVVGDTNFDGFDEVITGAGCGAGPHVKVFNGQDMSVNDSFYAFDPEFLGGVTVAVGDVTGLGTTGIIVGAGGGAKPHVRVFDHHGTAVRDFFAFDEGFSGGVTVGVMDRFGNNRADIIVGAGPGAEPHLRAFDCTVLDPVAIDDFFAFDGEFIGGIFVGSGSR